MTKRKTKPPLSRRSVDKQPPAGAATVLVAIKDVTTDIDVKLGELEDLYRERDGLYLHAQEIGATIPQMAQAAGLTTQGVKYMLAKARQR